MIRPGLIFSKLKPALRNLATLVCLWFSILATLLTVLLLHLPNASCSSVSGPRYCLPQYELRFLEVPERNQDIFLGAKDLLTLLSYVAVDLNMKVEPAASADYDDVNLVNTFSPSNVFKINHLGFCKDQTSVTKLPKYCSVNLNGLEPISMIVRDVGVQFGITSARNPRIMGESFVYAYRLGLNALTKARGEQNIFLKYLQPESTPGEPSVATRDYNQWQGVAGGLLLLQNCCWSISWLALIEFSICVLVIVSTLLTAPKVLSGRNYKNWTTVNTIGHFALRVLPIVAIIVNFLGVFISAVIYVSLASASANYGMLHRVFDLQAGSGFYVGVVRLLLECVLLWQALTFQRISFKTKQNSALVPSSIDNLQKKYDTDSILSSGATV
ncbi:LADA_0H14664g1_1 [Lachancea dasiensis]|uniref:LADA_0H14664g1_1 n=1 Tax=Lachancea dasiensis TaxID=1072105 RepID=A0A1G4K4H1_9SACH|nr:LADA_0H14664g1_1 [Lachancea dasiensis]